MKSGAAPFLALMRRFLTIRSSAVRKEEIRKGIYGVLGLTVFLGALISFSGTKEAAAEIQVNINLGPPPIVVAEPPAVVMIPHSEVYFVPQPEIDVFFYNGYWWSPRGPEWYRSRGYRGPWGIVHQRYVPVPVCRVPRNYRAIYRREHHIPYGQWKKQWGNQERYNHNEHNEGQGHGQGHGHYED